ncbi:hypothetical protein [Sediminicola luteus]|uniref:Uncharacterized protein n=1 Tax=Sediminicola luteus TaxID=319238 RepID=A0A2A4G7W1_9FLAO|nr:hypothetical protein [Sediminicola luteus]PCE64070.1 hypothetical protein B7P33_12585 [Sediminicola luteus]
MEKNDQLWNTIQHVWNESANDVTLELQIDELIQELKSKVSPWEKKWVKSDLAQIKEAIHSDKERLSSREKRWLAQDLQWIKKLFEKLFSKRNKPQG